MDIDQKRDRQRYADQHSDWRLVEIGTAAFVENTRELIVRPVEHHVLRRLVEHRASGLVYNRPADRRHAPKATERLLVRLKVLPCHFSKAVL